MRWAIQINIVQVDYQKPEIYIHKCYLIDMDE
jgi:hypothetical protein